MESNANLDIIAADIAAIRSRATNARQAFLFGCLQGAGAVIGGIVTLTLLGSVLSLLGVIPGFDHFENSVNTAVKAYEHR